MQQFEQMDLGTYPLSIAWDLWHGFNYLFLEEVPNSCTHLLNTHTEETHPILRNISCTHLHSNIKLKFTKLSNSS